MVFKTNRKTTTWVLILTLLASTLLTGYSFQDGIGSVYYETKTKIFDDTYFIKQLSGHGTNGIERTYIVDADTKNSGLEPYVYEGQVTGKYNMDTMVNNLEGQGYKVVAGINGDLYDTASGCPKGLVIHDGKIKTSGYAPEYELCFAPDGSASMAAANIHYGVQGTMNVPTTVATLSAIDQTATNVSINVPTQINAVISYFNVPHGAAKGLHLFNRQYADTTKTSGNTVEIILEAGSVENTEPSVNGNITATVAEVRSNTCNTPIGPTQLVLSTVADSTTANQLSQLVPGSTVNISVSDYNNGALSNCDEAIGMYYLLYNDGKYVATGTNLNPRTIVGIKPDGTILMYVLDGRQPGHSAGLGLTDTARHLVSMGCTTVINMDGGGSSIMAVREAGMDAKAIAKNSPSDGGQRRTTNGLFLVYKGNGNKNVENIHTYQSQPLAMPGGNIQLSTYASDNLYEKVSLGGSVNYKIDESSTGSVTQTGWFTAGSNTGTATVNVESSGVTTSAKIDVCNNIVYTTNVKNLVLEPSKTSDINVTAKYGYATISGRDSLYKWSCDPVIGSIDANGLFKAVGQGGVTGNIYVEYNNLKTTIPVQVGSTSIIFADTGNHWAKDYIGKLAARGIVNGMGGNYFMPENSLTRVQFLAMLAKTVYGLDVTKAASAGFTDVSSAEWYYNYVNWGYANGIVKGYDNNTFAPNANITREQMAIMLNNFTKSTNIMLPETNAGIAFTDSALINPWATDSVDRIVKAGIISGKPEGNYDPQGVATRAQAATVIYKYINIRDNIAKL